MIGGICPTGTYCPVGSVTPTACAPGKFSATTGNFNVTQCVTCTPGYYCPYANTSTPIICPSGYYCPKGTGFYSLSCLPGRMCPRGSAAEIVSLLIKMCYLLIKMCLLYFFHRVVHQDTINRIRGLLIAQHVLLDIIVLMVVKT